MYEGYVYARERSLGRWEMFSFSVLVFGAQTALTIRARNYKNIAKNSNSRNQRDGIFLEERYGCLK